MIAGCLLSGCLGLVLADAVQFRPLPPDGSADAKRPYELVWAGRRAETPAPVDRLESAEGWRAEATNGEARVSTADDRLVFGDGVMRLDYRGTAKNPVARAVREKPLVLPPFDTFSVWIYGNNFYGKPKDTPITQVFADFADADGKPFSLKVTTVVHQEWCKFVLKVPADLRERTTKGGCRHCGFRVTDGMNPDFRRLDFTSVCAYVETFGPLAYAPRAKRGVQVFADQPQGVNVGGGRLPFPTTERTVIPPCDAEDPALEFRFPAKPGVWDDLAFRVKGGEWVALSRGGGVWPRSAADRATATFRRVGNSVVADVVVRGGDVEELRFGTLGVATNAPAVPVPFYRWGSQEWDDRPRVVVTGTPAGPRFIGCVMDWTQSNASEPYMPRRQEPGVASFGGALYGKKTDGTRNDVFERFVWTVSPTFEGTLPNIPNPVSPWRHVTGRTCWTANPSQPDRATNVATWAAHVRKGIRRMTVTDHEVGWRDGMESYTFRTNSAPRKGGDPNWYAYARRMIDGFGFRYGPYNNFTDLAPVNEHWDPDHILRRPDGSYRATWSRCWSPKPLYGLEMCERLTPVIAGRFGFNTAYCDVHTAVSPWSRTDYDARVPGAGTFAQTFYAYGEIMLVQKRCWNGPVSSEGGHQWFYAGLVDQNYGQDCPYRLDLHPWIVDFDLLRMHPHGSDHGMGYASMLWGDRNVPKDVWEVLRTWYPATLAFGHAAFLLPQHPSYSYYMTLAIASRYSQENVRSIRYADEGGRLLTTSEAVLSGACAGNRIVVDYDAGTHVEVNLREKGGVFARGGDTVVFSGTMDGVFGDLCRGGRDAGYVYLNGRGRRFTTPGGSARCEFIRLAGDDGTEEVIPADNPQASGERLSEVGLPYAARRIVALGTDRTEERGEIAFRTDANGWTWFLPRAGDYSYRVTLPAGFEEPTADDYVRRIMAGGGAVSAADEPPLLERTAAVRDDGIEWIDGTALPLEGRAFVNAARPYARLPEEAFARPDLAQLRPSIPCPAGMCFRFTTDSDVLRVRWSLGQKPPYGICNATAILTAGIDVYRWIPDAGWRFWDAGFPRHQTNELVLAWRPNSPCLIHLPISTPLASFQLGVRRGAKVAPPGPRTSGVTKPVVVYGASMVHGFSSSRPGMVWTSILSRRLDVPVVNQGYQGHAKMEPSMCEYLSAIDASAYCFLACGGQLTLEEMRAKTRPFLERLHRARPDVPILMGEYYYVVGPHRDDPDDGKRAFVRELVAELKASDPAFWANLSLVTREELFCADEDGTIDAAHFNDRGAYRCAEAFGKALKRALKLK